MDTTTCNCESGHHHACDGYIAPLVYSDTRPCNCACHSGIFGRDFQRALRKAELSYYGAPRQRVVPGWAQREWDRRLGAA